MPSKTIEDFAYQVRDYMRGAEVVPSKNLLKNNLETSTFSGVTATHNADDSITLTNTATNNQWFGISAAGTINEFNVKLNANVTYVLSVGSNMPSGIALYGRDASENYLFRVESGASYAQYTPSNDIYINIGCRVSNGTATGGFTIYPMLCTLEEWEKSHTYEPYYVPLKDSMFKRSEQRVLGAKNINTYPYSETTHTEADITFTVTDDGIVDIDGTSSGSTQFDFHRTGEFNNLKVGERYILSGAPDIEYLTEDVGLRLVIANDINTSQRQNIDCPQGGEIEFTIPTGWHFHWFTYRIASGKTFSHAKVKPMIRLASDPDDTYQPYAMTNQELTNDAVNHTTLPKIIAEASANQTWATQIASIHTAFSGLTDAQKIHACLGYDGILTGAIFTCTCPATGEFSAFAVNNVGKVTVFGVRTSSNIIRRIDLNTDGTVTSTDYSNDNHAQKLILFLV